MVSRIVRRPWPRAVVEVDGMDFAESVRTLVGEHEIVGLALVMRQHQHPAGVGELLEGVPEVSSLRGH
jgi:hypothetical protein